VPRAISALLTLLLLLAAVRPVAAADDPQPAASPISGEVIPGEVVVRWRAGADRPAEVRGRGLAIAAELGAGRAHGAATLVSTGGRSVAAVVAELRADPAVEAVEPNYRVQLAGVVPVNDPKTAGQYSLDQMRVREAWSITKGGTGVVAVLDTGVMANHPDLAGRVLAGYDFVNNDTNAADDNGHGTWVAGIIAAKPNDGYGIAGISWTDKILPVKIMDREGTGSTADLLAGINYAADHGATVINMSVGGFPFSQIMQDAINDAWAAGIVLVGAAGNNHRDELYYPASFANVVSVSATQVNDEFAHWSSYGAKVDVSAPGASVQTTNCTVCTYAEHDTWGDHTYISGTSFATPNVSGVVALLRARFPSETPAQIVARLVGSVDDRGSAGWDKRYGAGRVNAYRALGASVASPARLGGDGLEPNNSLSAAKKIGLGATTRPTLYPAGDADAFAVDVPRAGRLDVRVTGVVDVRAYPWNRSTLPIDPVVALYTSGGTLITRVDRVFEDGTEVASATVSGPTRILVLVTNYLSNGSRTAYSITPTYVDTVAPKVSATTPSSGATNVSRFTPSTATFNEAVSGVTASSMRLRDVAANTLVPSTVTYDAGSRRATLSPKAKLGPERVYRVELTTAVKDASGNALGSASWTFTTGVSGFADTAGSPFDYDIAWLAEEGITAGCGGDRFCPRSSVTREQMASFLARGLSLPVATDDWFGDDGASDHEADINRLAEAAITGGCAAGRFCPRGTVTREQMASFLARALKLPAATTDFFSDDSRSPHQADINRLAAAGITGGCGTTTFCPSSVITRDQMAAFLHRALGD
jgi:subtilisin family serine protease